MQRFLGLGVRVMMLLKFRDAEPSERKRPACAELFGITAGSLSATLVPDTCCHVSFPLLDNLSQPGMGQNLLDSKDPPPDGIHLIT